MKKLITIIGAILVLVLGAGGVYAVMNHNTNKEYDTAINKAEKHVKQHEWNDAKAAYNDAAKVKKTDVTTAANEQLVAIMDAEAVAGRDPQGAIDILDKSMKQSVTVPVIMTEMKAMKTELQKQIKTAKETNGSRSDISSEKQSSKPEANQNQNQNTESGKAEGNTTVDPTRQQNIAEGNMTVAQARQRLAEQGNDISFVPDSEVEQLIKTVKASNGDKSLMDVTKEMHW